MGVTFRTTDEKQQVTKHVESIQVPCLDQGSKPCCSTYQHAIQWQHAVWACVKNSPFFREKPLLFYRCPLIFNHLPGTFPFCTRSVPVSKPFQLRFIPLLPLIGIGEGRRIFGQGIRGVPCFGRAIPLMPVPAVALAALPVAVVGCCIPAFNCGRCHFL